MMATHKLFLRVRFTGFFFFALFCTLSAAHAQFLRTSYFMNDAHYRMQLNPSLLPSRGYFNLPLIGAFNLSAGSASLSYQDIADIMDDSEHFYSNPSFLNRLKDKNTFNVGSGVDIVSAGWYQGQNFWSLNLGIRSETGAKLTKSLFTFLNEMDADKDNWRNSHYDISHQRMNSTNYAEVGLGYARQIDSRLTVGGKAKVLLGIGSVEMNTTKVTMNAHLPDDTRIQQLKNLKREDVRTPAQVEALRREIEGYYANLQVDARVESSFKGLNYKGMEEKGYVDDIDINSKALGIAGYGLGVDLGASYKVLDNLTVSAAVLDLGFISWSKNSTKVAVAHPEDINMKGSDYIAGIPTDPAEIIAHPERTMEIIRANTDRFQKDANGYMERISGGDVVDYEMLQLQTQETVESRRSRLASTIVLGGEYGFFDNTFGVGVLSTTRFLKPDTRTELTFSANYRPKSWLNVALSYSVIESAGKSFGLGLKLGPVFLGTDYMFLGKNSNHVNGFVGFSVPLGRRKVSKQG